MISWRNPRGEARDLGLNDYLEMGLFDALAQVRRISDAPVHAVGYCLGGTLLALGAAAHARRKEAPELKTITLLTAQTDFSEPGELGLFVDARGWRISMGCGNKVIWTANRWPRPSRCCAPMS